MEDTQVRDEPFILEEPEVRPQEQQDYFGFQQLEKYYLPDGISYFELQAMNEGQKSKFQKSTQRDMVLEKGSGNARFRIDPAIERHELIKASVVGWNLSRGGQAQAFGERAMKDFLELANPKVIEGLELAIRKLNPWLLADLTVEEIDRQIEELTELREATAERERGEELSSSK
jgi:hypothetical protein